MSVDQGQTQENEDDINADMDSIDKLLNSDGPIVKAVLLCQDGRWQEIEYDTSPMKMHARTILGAHPTMVGQYDSLQVIIARANINDNNDNSQFKINKHKLRWPFDNEIIYGDLLLYRMNDDAIPVNFTLNEYNAFYNEKYKDKQLRQEWNEKAKEKAKENEKEKEKELKYDNEWNVENENEIMNECSEMKELNDMEKNEMISIEKLKQVLSKQIKIDFVKLHGREATTHELSDMIEQHIDAMVQMSDGDDDHDDDHDDDQHDFLDEDDDDDDDDDDNDDDYDDDDDNEDHRDEDDNKDNNENDATDEQDPPARGENEMSVSESVGNQSYPSDIVMPQ